MAGHRLRVRPGEAAPVNGVAVSGTASPDASILTGVSMPVENGPGDRLTGATINKNGSQIIEVGKVGANSLLAAPYFHGQFRRRRLRRSSRMNAPPCPFAVKRQPPRALAQHRHATTNNPSRSTMPIDANGTNRPMGTRMTPAMMVIGSPTTGPHEKKRPYAIAGKPGLRLDGRGIRYGKPRPILDVRRIPPHPPVHRRPASTRSDEPGRSAADKKDKSNSSPCPAGAVIQNPASWTPSI